MPETEEITQAETTEETTAAASEQPIQPSFADVERQYRASIDAKNGKKTEAVESKPEVKEVAKETEKPKVADAADPKVDETKPNQPSEEVKKSGVARLKNKLTRVANENQELRDRLARLEGAITATKPAETKPIVEELVEPTRDKFDTDLEYITALRAFDKAVAARESDANKQTESQRAAEAEWNSNVAEYNSKLSEVKTKYPDFDKVKGANVTIGRRDDAEYNTVLTGMLMKAGPETIYHLMKSPADARHISDIDQPGLLAVHNADDIAGVVQWLSKHPDDIDTLNGLNPVKAQKFIGRIEAKIEAESASSSKQAETPKEEKRSTEEEAPKKQEAKAPVQAKPPVVDGPPRPKSELPPKLAGSPPSGADWKSPDNMSFQERERLLLDSTLLGKRR